MADRALVRLDDIRRAREIIGTRLHRTPLVRSTYLTRRVGATVWLKLELFQKTGSFKPRGVLSALATLDPSRRLTGVVSLSAGNHAQAVAWAASALGISSTIVMPATAVPSKVEATRGYGGEVIQTDGDLLAMALAIRDERGVVLIHPFDDADVIAGQGTIGLEIVEDLPDVDVVLAGCGGGGLLSGVAAAVKALRPRARVIGVEPTGASGMRQSLDRGAPVRLDRIATIADGLAAPFAGGLTFEHVRALVDDDEIVAAMRTLMERCKIVAEPAGAAALAALLSGRLAIPPTATVAVVVSGGNVDLDRLRSLL